MIDTLSPLALAYCAVVLVLSYALRGSTGFGGFAAMPLMALVVPMKTLVPVWTLLTIASSITIIGRDRQHVSIADIVRVAPACVAGIAIGLYFFKTLDARLLARSFGVLVIAYAIYSLWAATSPVTR
ncbi:MAG TPA: TSUP family transporter [Burkholderiales bacterium]|nr:TSUP family transporter [Burkholderiales bacterium]